MAFWTRFVYILKTSIPPTQITSSVGKPSACSAQQFFNFFRFTSQIETEEMEEDDLEQQKWRGGARGLCLQEIEGRKGRNGLYYMVGQLVSREFNHRMLYIL